MTADQRELYDERVAIMMVEGATIWAAEQAAREMIRRINEPQTELQFNCS